MSILYNSQINGELTQSVDAHELHAYLEVKTPFHIWMGRRIEEYEFEEDQNFVSFEQFCSKPQGGRPATKYALTSQVGRVSEA